MTSQGHAYAVFQRALARGSVLQIVAAASDLPRVSLDDALAICLAFLDHEPGRYPRAAAKWASRFCGERPIALADAQLLVAALGALPGAGVRAASEALIEIAARHDVRGVDGVLGVWLERHGNAD